jgi:hypothetical protein
MSLDIGPAWRRAWDDTARRLFRPLDFHTWLWLGFAAWLSRLGEGGFQSGLNFRNFGDKERPAGVDRVGDWIGEHLGVILAIAIPIVLLLVAAGIALLYLKSRAQFVFLDQVVGEHLLFDRPWHAYRDQGRSLFFWQLGFAGVALVVIATLAGLGILIWLPAPHGPAAALATAARVGLTVPLVLLFVVAVIAAILVSFFLTHFVVPIMAMERLTTSAAWRQFLPLVRADAGGFVLYTLVVMAAWMGVGLAVFLGGCLTCCVGFVLLALPWLGTLPILPALVFFRFLSVHYLAQLPGYDLFARRAAATT